MNAVDVETPAGYLLIDGENIDSVLWNIHGGERPADRTRWDQVKQYVETTFGQPVRALFFLNVTRGTPFPFITALRGQGYETILLTESGVKGEKVVDEAIKKTLAAALDRTGFVALASHDRDFAPGLAAILAQGRPTVVLGFRESLAGTLIDMQHDGLAFVDLEDDAGAYHAPLPNRPRETSVADFDPDQFL